MGTTPATAEAVEPSSRLAHAPAVLERRTQQSMVLLAIEPAVVLRGTGVAVWDAFFRPRTVAEVVEELAARYGVGVGVVARETRAVLEQLVASGALIPSPGNPAGRTS